MWYAGKHKLFFRYVYISSYAYIDMHIYHADHRKSINLDLNSSYENNKNN